MAVGALLGRRQAIAQSAWQLSHHAFSSQTRRSPIRAPLSQLTRTPPTIQPLPLSFRRAYTDSARPPKRRFRFFRWAWRLTLLTGLGLTGYVGYNVYLLRHPADQFDPDPSKKTLVILGEIGPTPDLTEIVTRSMLTESFSNG